MATHPITGGALSGAWPLLPSPTSRSVAPKRSRMSNTGTPSARKAALWNMACILARTSPKGTTDGEWLCTTAITSGRAL